MRTRAVTVSLAGTLVTTVAMAFPAPASAAAATVCAGEVVTLSGTAGDDVLTGTSERDVIAGLGGNDRIVGGGGDDLICGGDGADRVHGDEGDDVLFAGKARWIDNRAGSGYQPDRLDGGLGDDLIDIGSEPVDRGLGISGVITFSTADGIVVDLAARYATGEGRDTIVPRGGLRVVGTSGADVVRGSEHDEEVRGLGGADVIDGRGGSDRLYADAAAPSTGGSDDDLIEGGAGNDVVVGTIGGDTLKGGPDLDLVEAHGEGRNRVYGGTGHDSMQVRLADSAGVVVDGSWGRDDVVLDAANLIQVWMGTATVGAEGKRVGIIRGVERVGAADGLVMDYFGSPEPDTVYASPNGLLRARTYGGHDLVQGSASADYIDVGSGQDVVRGEGGRDTCLHAEVRRSCELLSPSG